MSPIGNKEVFWQYLRRGAIAALVIFLVWRLRQTVQLLLISLFIAAAITPLVEQMERMRLRVKGNLTLGINRGFAVGIIYAVLILILILTLAPAPRLVFELGQFLTNIPEMVRQIRTPNLSFLGLTSEQVNSIAQPKVILDQIQSLGKELAGQTKELAGQTVDFTLKAVNALGIALMSMLIAGFMVVNAQELLRKVLGPFAPEIRDEVYALIPPITRCLGAYVMGRIGTSALLGFCTYLALSLPFLDVPFAGALGLLVAVSNLIPFIGPILGLIPITIAAWGLGLGKVLAVVGFSFFLQQIEAFILQPWLVGPYLNLDPFELLLSIIVGTELLGVVGAIIAPPVAGVGRILFDRFYTKRRLETPIVAQPDSLVVEPFNELNPELSIEEELKEDEHSAAEKTKSPSDLLSKSQET